jgi:type VI secretion system secreted protein VgrG
MPSYVQADRPLRVKTPLGEDTLLLTGISGREAISELFRYQLDLMAENSTEIKFEDLLGEAVTATIELQATDKRYIS